MKQKRNSILIPIIISLFFSGCGHSISSDVLIKEQENVFCGGMETVLDSGIIFPVITQAGGKIQYFDFASGEKYVLCSRSGCKHNDTSCPAFYNAREVGLNIYDNILWSFREDINNGSWDFVQSSIDGTSTKNICSLRPQDFSGDSLVGGFSDVFYSDGYAYLILEVSHWDDESEYALVSIKIDSGKYEVIEWLGSSDSIVGIYDDKIVILKLSETVPLLSKAEFFSENGAESSYEEYYSNWFLENACYAYEIYDKDNKTRKEIAEYYGSIPETDYSYNVNSGYLYYTIEKSLHRINIQEGVDETILERELFLGMQCVSDDNKVLLLELDQLGRDAKRQSMILYDVNTQELHYLDKDIFGEYGWVYAWKGNYLRGFGNQKNFYIEESNLGENNKIAYFDVPLN